MTTVHIQRSEIEELIYFKLRSVQNEIDLILKRWNEPNADRFLERAKNGQLEEAEDDAIDLHQLLYDEKKLRDLLSKL